ncbi:hypothetical protein QR680_018520 [Steinernema hermaphroditum]|uniref:Uncharacterized protein n=1 Tax=Steinernema hermaphroditum TaxID=289476 RepID=A0AA39HKJ3_9BILA|nr:hypothetical protein QR680_018520 [Steinernema hermaphroditum]
MYFNNPNQNPRATIPAQNTYSQDYYSSSGYGTPAATYNAATGTYNGPMSNYISALNGAAVPAAPAKNYNTALKTTPASTAATASPMNSYHTALKGASSVGSTANSNTQNVPSLRMKMLEEENDRLRQRLQYSTRETEEGRRAYDALSREFHGLRGAHVSAVNEIRRLQEVVHRLQRPKPRGRGGAPLQWKLEREQWQQQIKRSEDEKKDASAKLEQMESELKDAITKLKEAQEQLDGMRKSGAQKCEKQEALEENVRAIRNDIEVKITGITKAKLGPSMIESMNTIQRLIKSEPIDYDYAEPKTEPMTPTPFDSLLPKEGSNSLFLGLLLGIPSLVFILVVIFILVFRCAQGVWFCGMCAKTQDIEAQSFEVRIRQSARTLDREAVTLKRSKKAVMKKPVKKATKSRKATFQYEEPDSIKLQNATPESSKKSSASEIEASHHPKFDSDVAQNSTLKSAKKAKKIKKVRIRYAEHNFDVVPNAAPKSSKKVNRSEKEKSHHSKFDSDVAHNSAEKSDNKAKEAKKVIIQHAGNDSDMDQNAALKSSKKAREVRKVRIQHAEHGFDMVQNAALKSSKKVNRFEKEESHHSNFDSDVAQNSAAKLDKKAKEAKKVIIHYVNHDSDVVQNAAPKSDRKAKKPKKERIQDAKQDSVKLRNIIPESSKKANGSEKDESHRPKFDGDVAQNSAPKLPKKTKEAKKVRIQHVEDDFEEVKNSAPRLAKNAKETKKAKNNRAKYDSDKLQNAVPKSHKKAKSTKKVRVRHAHYDAGKSQNATPKPGKKVKKKSEETCPNRNEQDKDNDPHIEQKTSKKIRKTSEPESSSTTSKEAGRTTSKDSGSTTSEETGRTTRNGKDSGRRKRKCETVKANKNSLKRRAINQHKDLKTNDKALEDSKAPTLKWNIKQGPMVTKYYPDSNVAPIKSENPSYFGLPFAPHNPVKRQGHMKEKPNEVLKPKETAKPKDKDEAGKPGDQKDAVISGNKKDVVKPSGNVEAAKPNEALNQRQLRQPGQTQIDSSEQRLTMYFNNINENIMLVDVYTQNSYDQQFYGGHPNGAGCTVAQNTASSTFVLEEENERLRQRLRLTAKETEEAQHAYDTLSRELQGLRDAHATTTRELRRLQNLVRRSGLQNPRRRRGAALRWNVEGVVNPWMKSEPMECEYAEPKKEPISPASSCLLSKCQLVKSLAPFEKGKLAFYVPSSCLIYCAVLNPGGNIFDFLRKLKAQGYLTQKTASEEQATYCSETNKPQIFEEKLKFTPVPGSIAPIGAERKQIELPTDVLSRDPRLLAFRYSDVLLAFLKKNDEACDICGLNLAEASIKAKNDHRDSHTLTNLRRISGVMGSRPWYQPKSSFWSTSERVRFGEQQQETSEQVELEVQQKTGATMKKVGESLSMLCLPSAGVTEKKCYACLEEFTEFYDADDDEWMLKDCMKDDVGFRHSGCA